MPAIWIAPALEDQAIAAGYSVVDAVTVITTHLGELIRQHAWELLGRAEIKRLLDALNESHPKLMEELVPKLLTLGEVGRVLEQLLRERVSIRDLGAILEALLETAPVNKSLVALVEAARQALGRRLVQPLLDREGQLPVLLLDAALEEEILATLSPETGQRLLASGVGLGHAGGAPPGRFFEASYLRLLCRGTSRAPRPESGALSRQALAGAGLAAAGGGGCRGDSAGDPAASGGNGASERQGQGLGTREIGNRSKSGSSFKGDGHGNRSCKCGRESKDAASRRSGGTAIRPAAPGFRC